MDEIEAELLDRALAGESSAGPFLVSYFGERLLGYARAHAPDLSDADREAIVELAIEAGVRAIRQFDRQKGSLLGWFRWQVRFQALAWRRRHPQKSPLDDNIVINAGLAVELAPDVVDALRSALARLPNASQVILALRDVEQLAYSDIADRLGITQDAARQRHKRAVDALRVEITSEPAVVSILGGGE